MNKPAPQLMRICLVCGLEKPLAAFLQITGTQGTIYGNTCSSCRGSEAKDKSILPTPEREEESSGGAGLKIDSKAKIHQEENKRQTRKKQKERQHENAEERKELILEKTERTETKIKAEKDHRISFIETRKKQGFLKLQAKKPISGNPFLNQRIQAEKTFITNQEIIETKKKEEAFEQEIKAILDDPTQLYIDPRFGERKLQTLNFRQAQNRRINTHFKAIQSLYKHKEQSLQKEQSKKSETTKDPFIDYLEKTSKSTPPKGR